MIKEKKATFKNLLNFKNKLKFLVKTKFHCQKIKRHQYNYKQSLINKKNKQNAIKIKLMNNKI